MADTSTVPVAAPSGDPPVASPVAVPCSDLPAAPVVDPPDVPSPKSPAADPVVLIDPSKEERMNPDHPLPKCTNNGNCG
uniref:Uncharacterized protein n=1 Tax=Oryza meridionalis TaxID=40149 RepID=A0A0E0E393_9ORYZ